MFAWRFADFCKNRSSNHRKKIDFKKNKENEFCIEVLGHFENRWILKKLLNLQNLWKHKQFTIGFPIVKYPDFYEFRRFSSFFQSIDFQNVLTPIYKIRFAYFFEI